MSEHATKDQGYRSGTTTGSKLGYGTGCVVGLAVLGAGMLLLFLGDCPAGAACHSGERNQFLAVLALAMLTAVAAGLSVKSLVDRLKRTDR